MRLSRLDFLGGHKMLNITDFHENRGSELNSIIVFN